MKELKPPQRKAFDALLKQLLPKQQESAISV